MHDLAEQQRLMASLVGHTITRTDWFDSAPDQDWTGHEMGYIWLDDGRCIEITSWGHDAWGASVSEVTMMDVEQCLGCGERHPDRVVNEPWGYGDGPHANHRHAWCTNGNNVAWLD